MIGWSIDVMHAPVGEHHSIGNRPAFARSASARSRRSPPTMTSGRRRTIGLLLAFENPHEGPHDLFPERTASPAIQRDFVARGQIALVVLQQARGHLAIP